MFLSGLGLCANSAVSASCECVRQGGRTAVTVGPHLLEVRRSSLHAPWALPSICTTNVQPFTSNLPSHCPSTQWTSSHGILRISAIFKQCTAFTFRYLTRPLRRAGNFARMRPTGWVTCFSLAALIVAVVSQNGATNASLTLSLCAAMLGACIYLLWCVGVVHHKQFLSA